MEECPVCLEPLTGTVVTLGCCRNSVHIQCYVEKCPLCRAPLPRPEHVAVPIPVAVVIQEPIRTQKLNQIRHMVMTLLTVGLIISITNR